jgi:hypothetical protein
VRGCSRSGQQAAPRRGNLPNVRANTGQKDGEGRDIFTTVGAAWPFNQGDGLNVRINLLPVSFDGQLMLVPPKDD